MCFTKNASCWHLLAIPHFQIRPNQINTHKDGYISQIECRVHVHLSLISYIPFIHVFLKNVYKLYNMYITSTVTTHQGPAAVGIPDGKTTDGDHW